MFDITKDPSIVWGEFSKDKEEVHKFLSDMFSSDKLFGLELNLCVVLHKINKSAYGKKWLLSKIYPPSVIEKRSDLLDMLDGCSLDITGYNDCTRTMSLKFHKPTFEMIIPVLLDDIIGSIICFDKTKFVVQYTEAQRKESEKKEIFSEQKADAKEMRTHANEMNFFDALNQDRAIVKSRSLAGKYNYGEFWKT